jgi:tetratricopeptide (TPR) repeat protein
MRLEDDNQSTENLKEHLKRIEQMFSSGNEFYFDTDVLLEIVDHFLDQDEVAKANKVISYSRHLHPSNADLMLKEAEILIGSFGFQKALSLLNQIEKIEPWSEDVHILKAEVYGHLKREDSCIDSYKKAYELSDEKVDVLFSVARAYQDFGKIEKAITILKQILHKEPLNELAISEITFCYEILDQARKAIPFHQYYVDEKPFSDIAWYNLGGVFSRVEEYEKSIEAYEFAIALSPDFASAYFNKANSLFHAAKYEDALTTYFETFEYETPDDITYCYIGECYERLDRLQEAETYFDKSVSANEHNPGSWAGKAICLSAKDENTKALICSAKSLELDELNVEFLKIHGEILEKLERHDDALDTFRKMIDVEPEDPDAWLDYAAFFYRNNLIEEACEVLKEGLMICEDCASVLFTYASYQYLRGNEQTAKEYFEKGLLSDFNQRQVFFDLLPYSKSNTTFANLVELYKK